MTKYIFVPACLLAVTCHTSRGVSFGASTGFLQRPHSINTEAAVDPKNRFPHYSDAKSPFLQLNNNDDEKSLVQHSASLLFVKDEEKHKKLFHSQVEDEGGESYLQRRSKKKKRGKRIAKKWKPPTRRQLDARKEEKKRLEEQERLEEQMEREMQEKREEQDPKIKAARASGKYREAKDRFVEGGLKPLEEDAALKEMGIDPTLENKAKMRSLWVREKMQELEEQAKRSGAKTMRELDEMKEGRMKEMDHKAEEVLKESLSHVEAQRLRKKAAESAMRERDPDGKLLQRQQRFLQDLMSEEELRGFLKEGGIEYTPGNVLELQEQLRQELIESGILDDEKGRREEIAKVVEKHFGDFW